MSEFDFLSDLSLLDLFRTEVETQAAVLNDGLLSLEKNPRSTDEIDALMRAAHSLKGAARMVGLDSTVDLTHAMEDLFVAVQEGKIELAEGHIDVLFSGVDILADMLQVEEEQMVAWLEERRGRIEEQILCIRALASGPPQDSSDADDQQQVETDGGFPVADRGGEEFPTAQRVSPEEEAADARGPLTGELPQEEASQPVPSGAESQDRVVRITSENLNRLMALAGEALVEARRLQPQADALMELKYHQHEVSELLEQVKAELEETGLAKSARQRLDEARQRMGDCRLVLSEHMEDIETFARRSENLSNRLYHEAIAGRMRPFADGVRGFPRMVRDLARQLGKEVHFQIDGLDTEVDRDILEQLEMPLTHMLRNALDHGIEMPVQRRTAGKPEEGRLHLEARHAAGMLLVVVKDDGGGMDFDRLRQKIAERQLAPQEIISQLNEKELLDFLFLPGFSTADGVTEISGRGVGLDVVQNMVREVGGLLHALSEPGAGMELQLQLPLTLSVMRSLLVEIAGEPYAFPLVRIDRALKIGRDEIESLEERQYCRYEEQNIDLVYARQVLELEGEEEPTNQIHIVVISDHLNRYGLVVDRFMDEADLVVQPLDPRLGKIQDIASAAFLEDGSPVLILDVEDLVRSVDNLTTGGRLHRLRPEKSGRQTTRNKRILVIDDSITVRELERKLLENRGYEVEVAVDGMDGWNALHSSTYDLVITDVDMPRMTGLELVRLIKQDLQLQSLPVIIISYKEQEEDRLRGLEAGANCYLPKSNFQDESLPSAVIDLIGEA